MIESLTETNAVIRVKGDKNGEPWNVSRQRLSKCSEQLAKTEPWLGQSGKLRKRRVVRKQKPHVEESPVEQDQAGVTSTTRRGREVRKPARFRTIRCDSRGRLSSKVGGSCKDQVEISEMLSRETAESRESDLVAVV